MILCFRYFLFWFMRYFNPFLSVQLKYLNRIYTVLFIHILSNYWSICYEYFYRYRNFSLINQFLFIFISVIFHKTCLVHLRINPIKDNRQIIESTFNISCSASLNISKYVDIILPLGTWANQHKEIHLHNCFY